VLRAALFWFRGLGSGEPDHVVRPLSAPQHYHGSTPLTTTSAPTCTPPPPGCEQLPPPLPHRRRAEAAASRSSSAPPAVSSETIPALTFPASLATETRERFSCNLRLFVVSLSRRWNREQCNVSYSGDTAGSNTRNTPSCPRGHGVGRSGSRAHRSVVGLHTNPAEGSPPRRTWKQSTRPLHWSCTAAFPPQSERCGRRKASRSAAAGFAREAGGGRKAGLVFHGLKRTLEKNLGNAERGSACRRRRGTATARRHGAAPGQVVARRRRSIGPV
jgi:hypothetical protein